MNTEERLVYMRNYQKNRYRTNAVYREAQLIRTNWNHHLNRLTKCLLNKINNTPPKRILNQFNRRIYKRNVDSDWSFRVPKPSSSVY